MTGRQFTSSNSLPTRQSPRKQSSFRLEAPSPPRKRSCFANRTSTAQPESATVDFNGALPQTHRGNPTSATVLESQLEDDSLFFDSVSTRNKTTKPANTATTSRNSKTKSSRLGRKKRPQEEDDDSAEEPRLTLRNGVSDQTPDDMTIEYTITWVCKIGGKKVAEDTIQNVRDSLGALEGVSPPSERAAPRASQSVPAPCIPTLPRDCKDTRKSSSAPVYDR